MWEKSDLPAGKFADEAASFWRLPRLGLQELMNVVGAVEHFSPRFLRESSVFPFRVGDEGFGLAVSDPADGAAIRAAEIVCGRPVAIAVASFDDIATVLELRLDERTTGAVDVDEPEHRSGDDDIDSLRDLSTGPTRSYRWDRMARRAGRARRPTSAMTAPPRVDHKRLCDCGAAWVSRPGSTNVRCATRHRRAAGCRNIALAPTALSSLRERH